MSTVSPKMALNNLVPPLQNEIKSNIGTCIGISFPMSYYKMSNKLESATPKDGGYYDCNMDFIHCKISFNSIMSSFLK